MNQSEVIPEVKGQQQLPTDFTVSEQNIISEEEKTPEKPARKNNNHTEKLKNPKNLPGTVPVMQPMMKMPDFQNELSKKLQKRLIENGENHSDDEKNETEEKTKDEKSVGKLNPNKTAGLKLEMRLPGMQPPIKLPSLQGKFMFLLKVTDIKVASYSGTGKREPFKTSRQIASWSKE